MRSFYFCVGLCFVSMISVLADELPKLVSASHQQHPNNEDKTYSRNKSDGVGLTLTEAESGGRETITVNLPGNVKMVLKKIPAGSFIMGSTDNEQDRESNEGPQRRVNISKPFYLGVYEVTQDQWKAVMGSNPSKFSGMNNPVDTVSWNDCQQFIEKLNKMNQGTFRLPTEAEWEYACRAGTSTRFYWGDDPNYRDIGQYAWYDENSDRKIHEVGKKHPNAFGLYDMSGNVWEWCEDKYQDSYEGLQSEDPIGPQSGLGCVLRGGGGDYDARNFRSAVRYDTGPDSRYSHVGFRLLKLAP